MTALVATGVVGNGARCSALGSREIAGRKERLCASDRRNGEEREQEVLHPNRVPARIMWDRIRG